MKGEVCMGTIVKYRYKWQIGENSRRECIMGVNICPATSLMYVHGGDRSLSHELLIVRRHNSLRCTPCSTGSHAFPGCWAPEEE